MARLLVAASLCVVADQRLRAQPTDDAQVLSRLQTLEELVRALHKQVTELNALVRDALPPPSGAVAGHLTVDISNAAMKGAPSARVAILEYSDFECPFCGRHAQTAYPEIQRQFIETGRAKYVFRHLPLEERHRSARKAAEAAECAREQGDFWGFHDRLFANQKALEVTDLIVAADEQKLDVPAFRSCLTEGRTSAAIARDIAEARRLGLTGTPAFLLGEIQTDGTLRVRRRIVGAQPFRVFETALNELLAEQ